MAFLLLIEVKEIVLPANESELELLHVIVGLGFPTAEQFMMTGVPSLTVYVLTFGKIVKDCGLTGKEESILKTAIHSKLLLNIHN